MNVLSLFDGMSCGRIALERLCIPVTYYFASEIDKYAIKVSEANYPDIARLGDVTKVTGKDLPRIDFIMGGSPCQGFSFAGAQLAFDDPRSALFFEYVRILKECREKNPDVLFLLENVNMKQEYVDVINQEMGVHPVAINSALVSAQNRQRLYWTNLPGIGQPVDKGIVLEDVLEAAPGNIVYMSSRFVNRQAGRKCLVDEFKRKASTLSAMEYVKNGRQGDYIRCGTMVGRKINPETGKRDDYNSDLKAEQRIEIRSDFKTGCLSTVQKDNLVCEPETNTYRKLTPIECERLQTVPDNYTNHVSNTQRYKMLGNGWTVDVIVHILGGLYAKSLRLP